MPDATFRYGARRHPTMNASLRSPADLSRGPVLEVPYPDDDEDEEDDDFAGDPEDDDDDDQDEDDEEGTWYVAEPSVRSVR